ncbi:putative Major facilitator superfamily-domain-containing protein [Seiridium cardinale]|uniref:Major facilitator superfamily-domain-containing protein n=1 Tax=Seiridium cardinale TaxID=138064 RepID=A0ABR2XQ79_9PEZI
MEQSVDLVALSRPSQRVFEAATPTTTTSRLLITSLLVCANTVQFISNCVTIAGGLAISEDLGRPDKANWMPASYPLTQSAFVLICGRLGAVYGHKRLTLLGCLIFSVFSLVNAFCKSYESFIVARALTGVGGGLFMPNAVSMITIMIPPGRLRNLFLGFFAASPPLGAMVGSVLTGVFIQSIGWKWLFVLIAALTALIIVWLGYITPKEVPVDRGGKIDYVGAVSGLGSLLLFNVVCNQAPSVGWSTPYVIACLVATVVLFLAFLVWEKRFASEPIMPLNIFKATSFFALIWVVLFSYMGFGITLWYSVSWQQVLRNTSVLQTGINFIPFGLASLFSVFLAAWLVSRVAAQWIMAVGVIVVLGASILLATMPVQQTYWAQIFPAIALSGFCPDFVFVAAQVIASNSVSRRQQGVASSLIGTLNLYGNSLGIGIAAIIESEVNKTSTDEAGGYRAVLYFSAGICLVGLVLDVVFVRMPKDERDGWDDPVPEEHTSSS